MQFTKTRFDIDKNSIQSCSSTQIPLLELSIEVSGGETAITYQFNEQNAIGKWGESILDSYLRRSYFLEPADSILQNQEIDRIARPKSGGKTLFLEYKTDLRADGTGNAFIETVGADANRENDGWATRSNADFVIYYLPRSGRVFIVPMVRLRKVLPAWRDRYQSRSVPNRGYHTHGLLVPLPELAQISVLARIPPCQPDAIESPPKPAKKSSAASSSTPASRLTA